MYTLGRYSNGRLMVEGVAAERIAREAGTPAYVYSARAVRERYRALDAAFRGRRRRICYALKANSNRSLCRVLSGLGAGADVVSGGELRRALDAGFKPGAIVFSGVGKTEGEIALALRAGILVLNVESAEELDAVARTAGRLKRRAPVSVRLNPDVDPRTHRHIATGRAGTKFGVERPEALALYARARRDPRLEAVGIQCHIGSQVTSVRPYRQALQAVLRVARELAASGLRLRLVDIGGGMGIRYRDETPLSVPEFASEVRALLRPWPDLRLLLEPGRWLVAEAGLLLTRVLYRKGGSRSRFVIVDAAMNDLMRPALYGAWHGILPIRASRAPRVRADVVGPVCETADFLAKGRLVPWPEPGEVLAVLNAGAYGFSMSSQYNSRPRPPEVLVEGGAFRVVRRREGYADLVRNEL